MKQKREIKDIDDLLNNLGSPGRYCILLIVLLVAVNGFIACNHITFTTVMGITPEFRCNQVRTKTGNDISSGKYGNWTVSYSECFILFERNDSGRIQRREEPCTGPWKFSNYAKTVVTQWSLVCHHQYLPSIANVLYFLGVMLGGFVCGILSDRYGRRLVFLVTIGIGSFVSICSPFLPHFSMYVAARFIQGFLNSGAHNIVSIYPSEMTPRKYLHYSTVVIINGFIISVGFSSVIAWGLKDWKYTQLVICAPSAVTFALAYRFFPESVRWLALHGKEQEVIDILKNIANINKIKAPYIEKVVKNSYPLTIHCIPTKHGIMDVFKTKEIRKRSLCVFYLWFVAAITYYGLSIELGTLGNDAFTTIIISNFTDVPAFLLAFWYIKAFGKRKPCAIFLSIGGLSCLSYLLFKSKVVVLVGKAFLASGFALLFLYVPEVYPTVIRNIGLGVCSLFSRIGSVLAPQIVLLGMYTYQFIPLTILGILCIIGSLVTLLLPETSRQKLPDTILEVESRRATSEEGDHSGFVHSGFVHSGSFHSGSVHIVHSGSDHTGCKTELNAINSRADSN